MRVTLDLAAEWGPPPQCQEGAGFKSLGDPWADTTTPDGRLMLTVLAGIAAFERDLILQRTNEGRARAMAEGVRFGRRPKPTKLCLIGLSLDICTIEENIERFDFGACMAAWDGKHFIKDDRFRSDVEEETFTLHRADNINQFNYSVALFEKIKRDRYENWTIRVSDEFENYLKERAFGRSGWYRDYQEEGFFRNDMRSVLQPKER